MIVFLFFAIVQLFGINSLDLYSSGVSLQAMGLRSSAIRPSSWTRCSPWLTIYAEFQLVVLALHLGLRGVIIVWIAPWFGIFIVDWLLRVSATSGGTTATR